MPTDVLPQFDALAVEHDVFDARLVRPGRVRIAEDGAGLAGRDQVRRRATLQHARWRRQDEVPVLAVDLHLYFAVRILKVDFRILPVTVNDFDVSYPPQP